MAIMIDHLINEAHWLPRAPVTDQVDLILEIPAREMRQCLPTACHTERREQVEQSAMNDSLFRTIKTTDCSPVLTVL